MKRSPSILGHHNPEYQAKKARERARLCVQEIVRLERKLAALVLERVSRLNNVAPGRLG